MTYTKQTWIDNNLGAPLSAARLNHIEDGIAAAGIAVVNDTTKVDKGALVFNARDYGALGDNTHDDTAGIQAAINAVVNNTSSYALGLSIRGGTVYIPAGRYRVTGQITLLPGVSVRGAGSNATVLINEGTTNDVFSFTNTAGGLIAPICIESLGIAQKTTVTHTAGAAIYLNGGGHGCTAILRQVTTNATAIGIKLRDTYASSITGCEAFNHVNGFYLDVLCTSLTFEGCYAGACSDSGYKICGNYLAFIGCASDLNIKDGYEVYYNGGSTVSVAFIGCGAERSGRYGISTDRASGIGIHSPRLIAETTGSSAIYMTGGGQISITAPVLSALSANAAPAIDNSNSSGAYPLGFTVLGFSSATNYTTLIANETQAWVVGDYTTMSLSPNLLRFGPITNYIDGLQSVFVGATPVGNSGSAYGIYSSPVATTNMTILAGVTAQPRTSAAAGQAVSRVVDFYAPGPVRDSGSLFRTEGLRVVDHTAGFTANANIALGATVPASGNWNIYSVSALDSFFAGAIRLGVVAGPTLTSGTGTPEAAVTAPVGSVFLRQDGSAGTSLYVKESGAGNTGWVAK